MNKKMPRRRKLILRWTLAGLAPALAGVFAVYWMRGDDRPYRPGEQIEGLTTTLDRTLPQDHPPVVFADVSQSAGIEFRHFWKDRSTQLPEDMGSGAAWGDYDNDGDPDLYLSNIAGPLTLGEEELARSPARNRLYRNNGDGTFSDVTEMAGVGFRGFGMGAAWADFDGDGDLDLAITTYGRNHLYRNLGNGSFQDVSPLLGKGNREGFWTGASWGDFDGDGDLDLYVCGYVRYRYDAEKAGQVTKQFSGLVPFTLNPSSYPAERNLLFQNEGGTFTETAEAAGLDNPSGRSMTAAWADFDADGRLDLYVANDVSDNVLYRNLGDGRFEDVSHNAWVADYRGAMGLAVGDADGDTDLDIFVTHWLAQENAFFTNLTYTLGIQQGANDRLGFMDVADQSGLGQIALDYIGWGTFFFDYDNDGLLDLFVVNGSTFQDETDTRRLIPMRDLLFWNRGEEKGFFDVGPVSGPPFQGLRVGRGAAFADYDGDGDLDLVVNNHGDLAQLLRNEGGNAGNWLKVQIRSDGMNHFGLGAVVEVRVGEKKQRVQLGAQPSYLSQNAEEAHFGLGRSDRVDQVRVTLLDGRTWRREAVSANQTLRVDFP